MSTISNPALIPPGGLGAPVAPSDVKTRTGAVQPPGANPSKVGPAFADVLRDADSAAKLGAQQQLHFSKHAIARIQRRGIDLDQATLGRLSEGVGRAAGKGSRDSLVLVDGTAFVVSVSNHTVITAVGSEHMKENVFTNIDSAVIA